MTFLELFFLTISPIDATEPWQSGSIVPHELLSLVLSFFVPSCLALCSQRTTIDLFWTIFTRFVLFLVRAIADFLLPGSGMIMLLLFLRGPQLAEAAGIAKCSVTKQALPNTTDAEVAKEVGGRK